VTLREDIYQDATSKKKARAGFHDPKECSVCGGKPAIFVWRRKGFCRKCKDKAQQFTASTPMLLPRETIE